MIPERNELKNTDIVLADFSKWAEEELAITNMIWDANWAHLNYIFIDRDLFSKGVIDKLRENGFTVVIGQGDAARIKISW